MRTAIELGPKGKKHVAYAIDWPGLERNGKTPEQALYQLGLYRPRYQAIAARAGLSSKFQAEGPAQITIEYEGVGSTDFWGISFAHSALDNLPISNEDLNRQLSLLEVCWAEFDEIASRVSAELQKGPRGGGRDRDHIVRHVLAAELDWAKKLDIRLELDDVYPMENRRAFHASIVDEIRVRHTEGAPVKAKGGPEWKVPFLIRHLAYHVMDHAWEMEDKDLAGKDSSQ